jgi:DNA-binding CsgD family transcriptional regulator
MVGFRTIDELLDATDAVLLAPDLPSLLRRFEAAGAAYDMTSFLLSGFPTHGNGHQNYYCHERLREWMGTYDGMHLKPDCPMTAHLLANCGPVTVEAIHNGVAAESRAAEVCGISRELGVVHGLLVPLHMRNGDTGTVSIMTAEELTNARDQSMLHMIGLAFHRRFDELTAHKDAAAVALSHREMDVLRWFAEGKSTEDVGDILDISASTVMFHYRRAAERLGTINRTHTVVEAMRRGLIGAAPH